MQMGVESTILNVNPTNISVPEQRVRAFVFAGLREALKPYGIEPTGLLRQAGIADDAGVDGFAWVPLDRFALALSLAARVTGDPCFGLKYRASGRLTSNPLGYVMSNAPDLRTALKSFVRYHRVLTTNRFDYVESAGAARVEWSYVATMPNVAQLADFVLTRFVWRVQCAVGSAWRPISVGLTHRQPEDLLEDLLEYERRVGPRIAFNQPPPSASRSPVPMPSCSSSLRASVRSRSSSSNAPPTNRSATCARRSPAASDEAPRARTRSPLRLDIDERPEPGSGYR
jgi:hypothetical protein